jgi:hypothetical protein
MWHFILYREHNNRHRSAADASKFELGQFNNLGYKSLTCKVKQVTETYFRRTLDTNNSANLA